MNISEFATSQTVFVLFWPLVGDATYFSKTWNFGLKFFWGNSFVKKWTLRLLGSIYVPTIERLKVNLKFLFISQKTFQCKIPTFRKIIAAPPSGQTIVSSFIGGILKHDVKLTTCFVMGEMLRSRRHGFSESFLF